MNELCCLHVVYTNNIMGYMGPTSSLLEHSKVSFKYKNSAIEKIHPLVTSQVHLALYGAH